MQAMSELIPVSIMIGDRSYRLRVSPQDEEVLRKTVKTINEKLIEFKTQFAGKDLQDYIAMVLIWFATEQNAAMTQQVEKENITGQLSTVEKMLDGLLKGVPRIFSTLYLPCLNPISFNTSRFVSSPIRCPSMRSAACFIIMKWYLKNSNLEQIKKQIHGPKHTIHYNWCICTNHWHHSG
jgi:cell division protein ZapA